MTYILPMSYTCTQFKSFKKNRSILMQKTGLEISFDISEASFMFLSIYTVYMFCIVFFQVLRFSPSRYFSFYYFCFQSVYFLSNLLSFKNILSNFCILSFYFLTFNTSKIFFSFIFFLTFNISVRTVSNDFPSTETIHPMI